MLNDECVWEGFSIHDTQLRLKWNRWGSSGVENELVSPSAHIIQRCLIKWALLTSIAMCRTRTHAKYLPFYVRPNVPQNIKLIINPKFGLRLVVLKLPSCTAALCDVITCSSQLCRCRRVLAMTLMLIYLPDSNESQLYTTLPSGWSSKPSGIFMITDTAAGVFMTR